MTNCGFNNSYISYGNQIRLIVQADYTSKLANRAKINYKYTRAILIQVHIPKKSSSRLYKQIHILQV